MRRVAFRSFSRNEISNLRSIPLSLGLVGRILLLVGLHAAVTGCALNGDFDRVRPELVSDDMHAWVGSAARKPFGVPPSVYPLTDEERQLRDYAYPLIEPPYERNRWYSVLNEYGLSRKFQPDWYQFDVTAYSHVLMRRPYRSATARYATLDDDIRNDVTRIDPFFILARRVIDTDRRRQATQGAVGIAEAAPGSAQARVAENMLIVAWVQQALADRVTSYRFALEQLVVATPTPMATEVERSLVLLAQRIAANQVVATPLMQLPPRPVPVPVAEQGPLDKLKQAAANAFGS
jgi:hypothetical protein